MKNKVLIIIVLLGLLIPLGAEKSIKTSVKNTDLKLNNMIENYHSCGDKKTRVVAGISGVEYPKYRPIRRKARFRRAAPRCPGF
jgi:hypothetical protein